MSGLTNAIFGGESTYNPKAYQNIENNSELYLEDKNLFNEAEVSEEASKVSNLEIPKKEISNEENNEGKQIVVYSRSVAVLNKTKAALVSAKNTTFNAIVSVALSINNAVRSLIEGIKNNIINPVVNKASQAKNAVSNFVSRVTGFDNIGKLDLQ